MSTSTAPLVQVRVRINTCGAFLPSWCPSLPGPAVSASVRTTVPEGVSKVVSRTMVSSTYRRLVAYSTDGRMLQWPALSSSRRAMMGGLSKRGKVNHSTEPLVSTSPLEWQSEMSAWSPIGVLLIGSSLQVGDCGSGRAFGGGQRRKAPGLDAGRLGDRGTVHGYLRPFVSDAEQSRPARVLLRDGRQCHRRDDPDRISAGCMAWEHSRCLWQRDQPPPKRLTNGRSSSASE